MSKNKSWWLKEHHKDLYVKKAKSEGYRSRAVYKLIELQERDHLFKPGMIVVELGAAPGGWSQFIANLIQPNGQLLAIDLLIMDPLEGVDFIQGDFQEQYVLQAVAEKIGGKRLDWVISDMAPNISGNESIDIPKTFYLADLSLDFALKFLKPEGGLLIKVFQGEGFDQFVKELKTNFNKVAIRKPKASRGRSREIYLLAKGLKEIG